MAYTYDRPDVRALAELEALLKHLGEELAVWRRRSLKAESELQEAKASGGVLAGPELVHARQRVIELELENQSLRQRVELARDRVHNLANRLSFLEQDGGDGAA